MRFEVWYTAAAFPPICWCYTYISFNIRGWPVQYAIDITYENLCHVIGGAYSTLKAFLSWIICLKIRLIRTNHSIDSGESSKLQNVPKLTRFSILTNLMQTPVNSPYFLRSSLRQDNGAIEKGLNGITIHVKMSGNKGQKKG